MTVVDQPLTGAEAAALYAQKMRELQELDQRERHLRETVLQALDAQGGRATIEEAMELTGFGISEFLPVLTDLLENGAVMAQGTLLVVPESPNSTP